MGSMLKLVKHYGILETIGSGGFGTVYKARDSRTGQLVALKIIRPILARDKNYIEGFLKNTRSVSSLDDPQVVKIYDYGQEKDTYFIATEYYLSI